MTAQSHSEINTWLLGIIGAIVLAILGLLGWCLSTVVDIGKIMSFQGQSVTMHTAQIAEVQKEVTDGKADIQRQVQTMGERVDRKIDDLQKSNNAILIAIAEIKKSKSEK